MTTSSVLTCKEIPWQHLLDLCARFQLRVCHVANNTPIPGSFWGDCEAGIIADQLFVRDDTPVHSALHEACHYICMDPQRRQALDTNAEGDYDEENGVCYLQILLSDYLPTVGRERLLDDMDRWGYSFRLGSSARWFYDDANDALEWLVRHQLVVSNQIIEPTWHVRVLS